MLEVDWVRLRDRSSKDFSLPTVGQSFTEGMDNNEHSKALKAEKQMDLKTCFYEGAPEKRTGKITARNKTDLHFWP